ncbi:hypothetical protein ACFL0D_00580 [Thermoproteota archaeon]
MKRLDRNEPNGTPIYVINSINAVRAVNLPVEFNAKTKKPDMNPV